MVKIAVSLAFVPSLFVLCSGKVRQPAVGVSGSSLPCRGLG